MANNVFDEEIFRHKRQSVDFIAESANRAHHKVRLGTVGVLASFKSEMCFAKTSKITLPQMAFDESASILMRYERIR